MTQADRKIMKQDLQEVKLPLEEWRNNREPGRRRIPTAIWSRAAELAVRFGVAPVAAELRLDYKALKSRMNALELNGKKLVAAPPTPATTLPPSFVELFPSLQATQSLQPCVLQVESPRGARLRVDVVGLDVQGLATLLREFA